MLEETVEDVTCRWCGNGNGVEVLGRPTPAARPPPDRRPTRALATARPGGGPPGAGRRDAVDGRSRRLPAHPSTTRNSWPACARCPRVSVTGPCRGRGPTWTGSTRPVVRWASTSGRGPAGAGGVPLRRVRRVRPVLAGPAGRPAVGVDVAVVTGGRRWCRPTGWPTLAVGLVVPVVMSDGAWADFRVTGYPFLVLVEPGTAPSSARRSASAGRTRPTCWPGAGWGRGATGGGRPRGRTRGVVATGDDGRRAASRPRSGRWAARSRRAGEGLGHRRSSPRPPHPRRRARCRRRCVAG